MHFVVLTCLGNQEKKKRKKKTKQEQRQGQAHLFATDALLCLYYESQISNEKKWVLLIVTFHLSKGKQVNLFTAVCIHLPPDVQICT